MSTTTLSLYLDAKREADRLRKVSKAFNDLMLALAPLADDIADAAETDDGWAVLDQTYKRVLEKYDSDADPLHPTGRCTCGGEGRCEWCRRRATDGE